MSLQASLDAFMANVRTQVPTDVLAPIERFYAQELHEAGRFPDLLRVGQRAPDFRLPDALGRTVDLAALRASGPVIVSFYRGAWCPFCNIELRALQQHLAGFQQLGASLVAVSPELPDQSMPLIERESLKFAVLSDQGNAVARAFGVVFRLSDEALRISRDAFGVDLPTFNGDDSAELPVPATFLIDRDGVIRHSFFDPEFRHRVEPTTLLAAIAAL